MSEAVDEGLGCTEHTLNINVMSSNGTVQMSLPNPLKVTMDEKSAKSVEWSLDGELTDLEDSRGRDKQNERCEDCPVIPSEGAALTAPT